MLIMAIPKGRLLPVCLDKMREVGLIDKEIDFTRKLSYELSNGITLFIVRNSDIITYVKNNIADLAFIGSDMLLEDNDRGKTYYDYGDVGLSKCRLMVAGRRDSAKSTGPAQKLRVATKYPRVAAEYYAGQGQQVDIIKINGSIELAASAGFVEQIVDIVDTGKTLKENDMTPLAKVTDCSTRLIINKGIMKSKWKQIVPVVDCLVQPNR